MWHEARKQERKLKTVLIDHQRRADRRKQHYEKIKVDPTQFLRVYGHDIKIEIDPNVCALAEGPQTMMPLQCDSEILIDRFDVRTHLDIIPLKQGDRLECSKEEADLERKANYERYRILVQNEATGVVEEKALDQITQDELYGSEHIKSKPKKEPESKKAAIGYVYGDDDDDGNDEEVTSECDKSNEEDESEKSLIKQFIGSDDESDSDDDFDLDIMIDIRKVTDEQEHFMNKFAHKYGMKDDDFIAFLKSDSDELEQAKIQRIMEEERAQFSGRKSRRERRAFKDKQLAGRVLSPPSYATIMSPKSGRNARESSSRSKSPASPVNSGPVFITSFGGESSGEEQSVATVPHRPTSDSQVKKGTSNYRDGNHKFSQDCSRPRCNDAGQLSRDWRSREQGRRRSRSHERRSRSLERRSKSRDRQLRDERSRSRDRRSRSRDRRSRSWDHGSRSRDRSSRPREWRSRIGRSRDCRSRDRRSWSRERRLRYSDSLRARRSPAKHTYYHHHDHQRSRSRERYGRYSGYGISSQPSYGRYGRNHEGDRRGEYWQSSRGNFYPDGSRRVSPSRPRTARSPSPKRKRGATYAAGAGLSSSRSRSKSPSPKRDSKSPPNQTLPNSDSHSNPQTVLPDPVVKKYRRKSLSSDSESSASEKQEEKLEVKKPLSATTVIEKKAKTNSIVQKMKKRMQNALSKTYRADKRAQQEKEEKEEQQREDREESLRAIAIQLRRQDRLRRHRENHNSSSDSSSRESSPLREKWVGGYGEEEKLSSIGSEKSEVKSYGPFYKPELNPPRVGAFHSSSTSEPPPPGTDIY